MQSDPIRISLRRRDGSIRAVAVVDAEDAHLAEHRWSIYAHGYVGRKVKRQSVLLHRVVLGLEPGDGLQGDHINRDKLDNRRSNLRVVTPAQNTQNRGSHGGTSTHRGVSWNSRHQKWNAQVCVAGCVYWCGYFADESAAAEAVVKERLLRMPFTVERT